MFKKGDKVRCIKPETLVRKNGIYEVVTHNYIGLQLKIPLSFNESPVELWFYPRNFKLATEMEVLLYEKQLTEK